ncbi:MAG TPA: radical SAM protein [Methanosarcinales archaeon]|nr:radical SAM protein [Methanosarcinales archaeon]
MNCELAKQGRKGCKNQLCKLTLSNNNRLITSMHLSRPENYFSIYQSGCNFECKKCHSWYFTQIPNGVWYSPYDILKKCKDYDKKVTLKEQRSKATAYHAHDTCICCGLCLIGKRSKYCPNKLNKNQIILSLQGYGPARNIVGFTGGDLTCKSEFYCKCAELIKENTDLWVLIETNGFGLTPKNLILLKNSEVDSFWLDIKAYDDKVHKWLTGYQNEPILELPEKILEMDFVLEVLSLYIPNLVEEDQIYKIANLIAEVDENIPFTILAFFPEYEMLDYRSPTLEEMIKSFKLAKSTGLKNIRLGNTGIFAKTNKDFKILEEEVGIGKF